VSRRLTDWLDSYIRYTQGTESPRIMHFFAGCSAIAGALRRKVWIDQVRFKWFPGMYIVFVADPGIATKSTTADLAMDLLREVPGVKFGPDNVTWQSLVTTFAGACESFEYDGQWYPMSAITLVASEFGSLMDLHNQEMINLFITLWDGRPKYEKSTKMSGNDTVEAPWINLLACTTPSWIATNMDQLATSGGLTSRTVYVFAEGKANYIAYLDEYAPKDIEELKANLIHDLEYISMNLAGPFTITPEARTWGRTWYENLWKVHYSADKADWLKGYLARKQAHIHKLAMILSVSRGDSLTLTPDDLILADTMFLSIEADLSRVFSKVGKSPEAIASEKLVDFIRRERVTSYEAAYRMVEATFPNHRDFEGILNGAIRSGRITMAQQGVPNTPGAKLMLLYVDGEKK
jgi:Protein of unknown function (DUF3987)